MIFKLDIEKAYDMIECDFLTSILSLLGSFPRSSVLRMVFFILMLLPHGDRFFKMLFSQLAVLRQGDPSHQAFSLSLRKYWVEVYLFWWITMVTPKLCLLRVLFFIIFLLLLIFSSFVMALCVPLKHFFMSLSIVRGVLVVHK